GGGGGGGGGHGGLAGTVQDRGAADEQARIDAERPADEAERHDRADAQSAAADWKAETASAAAKTSLSASILDVAAFRQIVQAHGFASLPAAGHTAAAAVAFRLPPRRSTRRRHYSCQAFLSQSPHAHVSRFLPAALIVRAVGCRSRVTGRVA